jgi:streptogramin lyase
MLSQPRVRRRARFAVFAALVPLALIAAATKGQALEVDVRDSAGTPVAGAMVTLRTTDPVTRDTSDGGYPQPERVQAVDRRRTRFSDPQGHVEFGPLAGAWMVRVRKPGWRDTTTRVEGRKVMVVLDPETDASALAAAKPGNVWTAALDLGDAARKKRFMMQCGFCHQQGSSSMRLPRTAEAWALAVTRMIAYGSRLPTSDQTAIRSLLPTAWADLLAHPERLADPRPWQDDLHAVQIDEWPVGDAYSQMHDMLALDGRRYVVGDNINDRLWEIDSSTDRLVVHKLPHDPEDKIGGLIAARLRNFPRHEDYTALHSLARSHRDGHVFLTPSNQRRLIEWDPSSGRTWVHRLSEGFYPHTVRVDAADRVWFTLALSNQIAVFDRASSSFRVVTLPARSLRESVTLAAIPTLFWLADKGVPIHKLPIDDASTGVPLPYGIDIAPDGGVWFARLHAADIGRIDPNTLQFELFPTPFLGPRRLRVDARGNVWVCAFPESAVFRFDPRTREFRRYDLPTQPRGSDTPYSLAVDRRRDIVWVTGTASDTLNALHVDTGRWDVFPLPQRMTFTRDIDVLDDGAVITSNGAFPAWHIEDGQPTLIRVVPPWAQPAK